MTGPTLGGVRDDPFDVPVWRPSAEGSRPGPARGPSAVTVALEPGGDTARKPLRVLSLT